MLPAESSGQEGANEHEMCELIETSKGKSMQLLLEEGQKNYCKIDSVSNHQSKELLYVVRT